MSSSNDDTDRDYEEFIKAEIAKEEAKKPSTPKPELKDPARNKPTPSPNPKDFTQGHLRYSNEPSARAPESFEFLREKKKEPATWPSQLSLRNFFSKPTTKPLPIIGGLLDAGTRLLIGGSSKTYKTWMMCDLCLSVASGTDWFHFHTEAAPVLYVNFEVIEYHIQQRLRAIFAAKKLHDKTLDNFFIWHVRNLPDWSLRRFVDELLIMVATHNIKLIAIDPFYKLLDSSLDENNQTDMAEVLRKFDPINTLATSTAFAVHFSKGSQALKEPEDRISGAGSLGRDPDCLITLTKNSDNDHAFTLDFVLRDHPPIDHFGVSWIYPLLVKDPLVNPDNIKGKRGPKEKYPTALFVSFLKEYPDLPINEFRKLLSEELEIPPTTVFERVKSLVDRKTFIVSPLSSVVSLNPSFDL